MNFPNKDEQFDFTNGGPCGVFVYAENTDKTIALAHYKEALRRAVAQRLIGKEEDAVDWFDVIKYFERRFGFRREDGLPTQE